MNEATKVVKSTSLPKSESTVAPPQSAAATATGSIAAAVSEVGTRVGNFRWVICGLLFFAATINYLDRQVIATLKGDLQRAGVWDEIGYSWVVFAFQTAYAIGLLVAGRVMDWLGTRKGFSLSVLFWSVAAMAHAAVSSVAGFAAARFALGLGEAGNFPACIKTVAEWFPRKERALATGIFNAGTNVGILVAAAIVPPIATHPAWGWRWAFIVTGLVGFVWLACWLVLYKPPEEHPRLSKAELAYIQSDPAEPATRIPWSRLLPHKQTWAFSIAKFMTDPIWWIYLFWLPDFLNKNYKIDLKNIGLPLIIVYLIADVGSVAGGWLSSSMIKRGVSVNRARKTAMLICACAVVPVVFAAKASNVWIAVLLVGLAAAAHQGWSANLFTTTSDMFPRRAIGSVVGIGGMAGAVGGMLISKIVGYILQFSGSYVPIFIIAACTYLAAWVVIQLLVPKLEPARLEDAVT
ncbi:MAG TPA: MFS transporter [Pyrinomonadaceae bacterium]|jgi:ACS family hexuronate transporter-like MFS transporter|nr:MFS transporter [Pyrinomonadaceae bacterium]